MCVCVCVRLLDSSFFLAALVSFLPDAGREEECVCVCVCVLKGKRREGGRERENVTYTQMGGK